MDGRKPSTHEVVLPLFQPSPTKRYRTLVADPPWRYDSKMVGLRGATDYPTMTTAELLTMPVGLWAEDNAHLYLWTTNSFMVDAFTIAKAWGFEPKTILTWIKGRIDYGRFVHHMGTGFYFRNSTEHVLFCVRGSLPALNHDAPTTFIAPRTEHSAKPDTFYDLVQHMSAGPYLDVFSRKQRMGWETFGNECFNFGTELPPETFLEPANA